MASRSRRRPVRGFISWKRFPQQEFIKKHLLYQEVSAIKDTRTAIRVLENNFAKLLNGIKELTPGALQFALEPTFQLSQEYCPVDTGRLVSSGYLRIGETAAGPRGEIGYAPRNDPPYAVWVHERTDLHHEAPTRAKFLQAAMEEDMDSLLPRVREYLAGSTGVT